MEKEQRNVLRRAVEQARKLLEREVSEQLEGVYGFLPDGRILDAAPGDPIVRERLREVVSHHQASGMSEKQAVDRTVREFAFTVLNRFAGLKMAERRGLVRECISKGLESEGMRELIDCAPGVRAACDDGGFRLLLETIMDELSLGLNVLFDRRSPTGLIWPRPQALDELLEILNDPEVADLWEQDETIGWIYQYFNPKEEREAMRKASSAPRDSRELAVRNQFFTPRYVVEFLTDNTLGRIWYEMRKGDTHLKEACRYLVRRPNEIFLEPGQEPPGRHETQADLSQDELLRQPVYVLHRPKKDPRDLRILDPACGSGHFLLYAFELLETIYEEAWADQSSPPSGITDKTLRQDYSDIDALRRAIPGLILRHNLHGIEIDLRCCQIAALALWLRAQRSYQRLGLSPGDRPRIMRSNIVCAEPMPGEKDMLQEFTSRLRPRVLGQLVEIVFEKMQLAGEAGSLLKIEEELRGAVAEAKKQWQAGPKPEQVELFPEGKRPKPEQQRLFDVSGITDEEFWETAEEKIFDSLRAYADETSNGKAFRRRLFAEDAAQGFAFVDLCRKRFDVALMNPPFGLGPEKVSSMLDALYVGSGASELCASFYGRILELLHDGGLFGAISSRTCFYLYSLSEWRRQIVFQRSCIELLADLGEGILDTALNETAAYIVRAQRTSPQAARFGMFHDQDGQDELMRELCSARPQHERIYIRRLTHFRKLPDIPLCYWVSEAFLSKASILVPFGEGHASVQMGLAPRDEFRFSRLWWEVPPIASADWTPYAKGGEMTPYYCDIDLVLRSTNDLAEIKADLNRKYPYLKGNLTWVLHPENDYFKPGLTFGQRTTFLRASALPTGCYFSVAGKAIFGRSTSTDALLQAINTQTCQFLVSLRRERLAIDPQYQEGDVARMPWPNLAPSDQARLSVLGRSSYSLTRRISMFDEVDHAFVRPIDLALFAQLVDHAVSVLKENEEEADSILSRELGITDEDRKFIDSQITPRWNERRTINWFAPAVADEISYAVGAIFGRWDVRLNKGDKVSDDPFTPIPFSSPGMLRNDSGLPAGAEDVPEDYPIPISWSGILAEDPENPDDLVRRVGYVIEKVFKHGMDGTDRESSRTMGDQSVREYFRKPAGFLGEHLRRYSRNGRRAPIYWPLSTTSGSYTLWIYYQRLTEDTLFKAVTEYVTPKIGDIEARIAQLEAEETRAEGRKAAKLGKELAELAEFRDELKEFREELLRVARLPYKPNLNDGVQITAAPLWKLFRLAKWRSTLEETWKALERGDYDWAHLALAIWPDRVKEKCRTDYSLAIAHDLDSLYQGSPTIPARKARKRKTKG